MFLNLIDAKVVANTATFIKGLNGKIADMGLIFSGWISAAKWGLVLKHVRGCYGKVTGSDQVRLLSLLSFP